MPDMTRQLLCDDLWNLTCPLPLLPPEPPKPRGGRPHVPDRAALTGILFVLTTGIPWERLPQELGYGSGVTCRRRLRDWNHAGVWHRLHEVLLAKLREADLIDWERASIDSATVPAPGGAMRRGLTRRIVASLAPKGMFWRTPAE